MTFVEQPKVSFTSKFYVETIFLNTENPSEQVQFDYSSVKPIRDNI